ncbi:hypothetical protein QCA50_016081 [Cerrena zonata]|uniref:Uncharacterized protein n=1 Tax=Cerrena zonata TaxID=2478898 RepID=A0AAW0FI25_9APHY
MHGGGLHKRERQLYNVLQVDSSTHTNLLSAGRISQSPLKMYMNFLYLFATVVFCGRVHAAPVTLSVPGTSKFSLSDTHDIADFLASNFNTRVKPLKRFDLADIIGKLDPGVGASSPLSVDTQHQHRVVVP